MTRTIRVIATTLLLLAASGCASSDPAPGTAASNRDHDTVALALTASSQADDEVVTLDECPAAVQTTIKVHLNGGTIKEIERTTDHGEVLYEVDVQNAGVIDGDLSAPRLVVAKGAVINGSVSMKDRAAVASVRELEVGPSSRPPAPSPL